ncbi:hypothetical protein HU200_018164 [Digitaria exilis]|uniref:Peptidase C14 caspase domain-containing protein n=1 Tax=Digitaria exilis TaxID=1010633 RepID=A0A835F5J5_9POAL|nr:hypothetical protein HU200_018164 [Digitaria exilis]
MRPLPTASSRTTTTRAWCAHCGMGLAAPPGSSSSVRCALCHRVTTRIIGRQRGVGDSGMTTTTVAVASPSPPPRAPPPLSVQREIPASYPKICGKKRALLVGVSYTGTAYELKGTVNDVAEMRRLLVDMFGFPSSCILELTEKQSDPTRLPTRENLLLAMRWLTEGCTAGDSLVFQFAGHGVQRVDMKDDEVDGYDEALCPVDFERDGNVVDDEINDTIVRPLGTGVKLHAIMDTCHSGTSLDLPYLCRMSRTGYWQWEDHCRHGGPGKRPHGGLVISISSCRDDQKSADTSAFAESASIGAMMDSFIQAVEAEPGTTYGRLLGAMRARIRDGHGSCRIPGRFGSYVRRKMTPSSSVQEPQLCSSEMFDIYRKPFLL